MILNPEKFIEYHILPERKTVRFQVMSSINEFEQILALYKKEEIVRRPFDFNSTDFDFVQAFPFYDYARAARIYRLTNGFIIIDQRRINKTAPFIVCSSIEEYELISKYLIVLRDSGNRITIKTSILSHTYIKKFLENIELSIDVNLSNSSHKIFKAPFGQWVYVRFSEQKDEKKDSIKTTYISLIVYESLEILKQNEGIDVEYDESDFPKYDKRLILGKNEEVRIEVVSLKEAEKIIGSKEKNILQKGSLYIIDDKNIMSFEKGDVCLIFENINEYELYVKYQERNFSIVSAPMTIGSYLGHLKDTIYVASEPKLFSYRYNDKNNLIEELTVFDQCVNRYFFDDIFIDNYFVKFSRIMGYILMNKLEGEWGLSKSGNPVFIRKDGVSIDFVNYIFKEMIDQRYTGSFSSLLVIESLLEFHNPGAM